MGSLPSTFSFLKRMGLIVITFFTNAILFKKMLRMVIHSRETVARATIGNSLRMGYIAITLKIHQMKRMDGIDWTKG